MNLNQFAVETFPDWIGMLLVVGCALWLGWECLIDYCDRQPIVEEKRYPVNEVANVAEILMHMGLMNKLPEVRKAEHQHWPIDTDHIENLMRQGGCSDQDIADTLKGTRL